MEQDVDVAFTQAEPHATLPAPQLVQLPLMQIWLPLHPLLQAPQ